MPRPPCAKCATSPLTPMLSCRNVNAAPPGSQGDYRYRLMMLQTKFRFAAPLVAGAIFLFGCGLKRHKYDNPITKDTQQPDKVLFDKAINDIEHSRFEIA